MESKAIRKENERKEKEQRRAAQKEKESAAKNTRDRDRKRPNESNETHRETKRQHVEGAKDIPVVGGHAKSDQDSMKAPESRNPGKG